VGGGGREMLSKFGRQHLDPQELGCGVLANARRGETNIEAVAEAGEEARSGTINGVASKLATGKCGGGAEDGTGVSRLLGAVHNVPYDAIVDSRGKGGHGVEHHSHGSGSTAYRI